MSENLSMEGSFKSLRHSRAATASFGISVVTAAALLLAGGLVADTITSVVRLHSALPYWDEWDNLTLLKSLVTAQASLKEMFSQNNEHRIFFPRVMIFSDYLFFGGRGLLNLIAIFATQMFHAVMLLCLLQRVRVRTAERTAIASVIMMLLFSLRQEENFSWGLQVAFVGVYALATLAIILFSTALVRIRSGRPYLFEMTVAFATASIATFTMANGLFSVFVMAILAAAVRAPLKMVLGPLALGAVLLVFYLHDYQPMVGHTSIEVLLTRPINLLSYTSIFIGNFLYPSYQMSRLLGLWGLLAFGAACWRLVILRDDDSTRLALFGIISLTVISALATEVGRFQFGVDQAFSSRYSMGSAVFWSATLIYWWSVFRVGNQRSSSLGVGIVLTAVVLACGAIYSQRSMKEGMEDRASQQRLATDAMLLGLTDEGSFGAIDDPTESLTDVSAFLKERSISIYGRGDALLVGKPIESAGDVVDSADCQGSIDNVSLAKDLLVSDAARISGRVWGKRGHRATESIYIVDSGKNIVGFGTRESPFQDPSIWNGFALSPSHVPVSAFLRLADGGLCSLGTAIVAP